MVLGWNGRRILLITVGHVLFNFLIGTTASVTLLATGRGTVFVSVRSSSIY